MNDAIIEALRVLLAPQPLGQGAIRLQDWNGWPEEQREACERLSAWATMRIARDTAARQGRCRVATQLRSFVSVGQASTSPWKRALAR